MSTGQADNKVQRFRKEVLRAAAVDLTGKALVVVGGSLLAAFALLVWQGGSIPAWTAVVLVIASSDLGRWGARHIIASSTRPIVS